MGLTYNCSKNFGKMKKINRRNIVDEKDSFYRPKTAYKGGKKSKFSLQIPSEHKGILF